MPTPGAIQPIGATPSPRPLQGTTADTPQPKQMELRKLRNAVADFEALFLSHMLKSMQGTVVKTKLGKESGGDLLKDMGWEKVGESLAHQGGLGLGDMLFEALSKRVVADTVETENKTPTLEDLVGLARLGHRMKSPAPDEQ